MRSSTHSPPRSTCRSSTVSSPVYVERNISYVLYADMCHVLTVFTFTESAKHAYRSISAFVKHVVDHSSEQLAEQPFPDLNRQNSHDTFETAVTDDQSEKQAEESRQVHMLRERVDVHGKPRPMESMDDMSVLKLKPAEIGIIKEEPCLRWLHGQEEWDRTYKRQAERAIRQRQRYREKAEKMISNAREQGLKIVSDDSGQTTTTSSSTSDHRTDGVIQIDRRWGPLDLDDENPPPTAIAKRRDTPEAIALLKKHIYHTAPATHRVIPKLKLSDAVKASLDPNDDPNKPPKQSVSEAQVRNSLVPDSMHGLRIWDVLVGYFMRKSTEKAANGKNAIKKAIKS
ncbi:unnamed protein product [Mycena citricolor]|uniref:Uncharacterized protein n=1 Tax=Mycena citricolor TaxID=2018698 RepID=A0AAD2GTD1_9AGAR|nr:unnamed protein product [Mycena citricolor]CAK5275486.1 unnamed protein product [Mycena citricolor]